MVCCDGATESQPVGKVFLPLQAQHTHAFTRILQMRPTSTTFEFPGATVCRRDSSTVAMLVVECPEQAKEMGRCCQDH